MNAPRMLASVESFLIPALPDPAAVAAEVDRCGGDTDLLAALQRAAALKAQVRRENATRFPVLDADAETPCPVCQEPVGVTLVRYPGDPDELAIEPSCECMDSPCVNEEKYLATIEDRFRDPLGHFDMDRRQVAA